MAVNTNAHSIVLITHNHLNIMIATVKFNLLPTGVENITKEWVEKNHEDFVSIKRFAIFSKGSKTPEEKVQELKAWYAEIVSALRVSWEHFLSCENEKMEHGYRNGVHNKLLRDEANICRKCLERKCNESVEQYIQRVVPLLVMPLKGKDNRSVWVEPVVRKICREYEFKIGDPSGKQRNNFFDKIAQSELGDVYFQRFQRSVNKHFGAHFYYERVTRIDKETCKRVIIQGKICYYKISDVANNKRNDAADTKNEFLRCTDALIGDGVPAKEIIKLVKSRVSTPCHLFYFLLSTSLTESTCFCIPW